MQTFDARFRDHGVGGNNDRATLERARRRHAGQCPREGHAFSAARQYDQTGLVAPATSAATTNVVRSPDGLLLAERVNGATNFYLYDGIGSVVALVSGSGTLEDQYSYDPYGSTTSASEHVSNPFRYVSALWDSSTGLYKTGARYYDPVVGGFVQSDAVGSGYSYAIDEPINFSDPSGMMATPARGGGSGSCAPNVQKIEADFGFFSIQDGW